MILLAAYAIGAVGTFVYNGAIIVGPIRYGTVLRNALLWPIYLPILIYVTRA
jgi:ABC-type transport system involved in cytochrome c biogenesis permease component